MVLSHSAFPPPSNVLPWRRLRPSRGRGSAGKRSLWSPFMSISSSLRFALPVSASFVVFFCSFESPSVSLSLPDTVGWGRWAVAHLGASGTQWRPARTRRRDPGASMHKAAGCCKKCWLRSEWTENFWCLAQDLIPDHDHGSCLAGAHSIQLGSRIQAFSPGCKKAFRDGASAQAAQLRKKNQQPRTVTEISS